MQVKHYGTVVSFEPETASESAFLREEVQSESWQWMGPALVIDRRVAEDFVQALRGEGFTINLQRM